MRLNFWQWIGAALLILGAILLFTRKTTDPGPNAFPPATQQAR